jgi:hypothetical protein
MSPSSTDKPALPIPVGELVRRLVERKPELGRDNRTSSKKTFPPVLPQYGAVITGRLVTHGSAIYPLAEGNRPSYFVKILTSHGPETLWGADLKRAIEESQTRPKPNSIIGAQRVGYQILKVPRDPNAKNDSAGTQTRVRRTRWRVESVTFFADQIRESRKAREERLKDLEPRRAWPRPAPGAKLGLAAQFADRHIPHPLDREAFLKRVEAQLSAPTSKSETITRDRDSPTR